MINMDLIFLLIIPSVEKLHITTVGIGVQELHLQVFGNKYI